MYEKKNNKKLFYVQLSQFLNNRNCIPFYRLRLNEHQFYFSEKQKVIK